MTSGRLPVAIAGDREKRSGDVVPSSFRMRIAESRANRSVCTRRGGSDAAADVNATFTNAVRPLRRTRAARFAESPGT
jgi:hypothetical protein